MVRSVSHGSWCKAISRKWGQSHREFFNTTKISGLPLECLVLIKKGMVNMKGGTKIEFGFNRISRIQSLDEFAELLFPSNRNHQRLFLAIFVELKYADGQFLKSLEWVADEYRCSRRVLEVVRAKMRRIGLIDHVSRFGQRHGYREGWVFSTRFAKAAISLCGLPDRFREIRDAKQEARDRDLFRYL